MKNLRKLAALVLVLVLSLNLMVPALAVNSDGVTFTASLDKSVVNVSDQDQTVKMTVSASQNFDTDGMGMTVVCDAPLTCSSITNTQFQVNSNTWNGTAKTGIVTSATSDAENITINCVVEAEFVIPANTPAGTYSIGINKLQISKDYGTPWETGASATTTLTIAGGEGEETGDYAATLTPATQEVNAGENTVTVTVGANKAFASTEFVVEYNSTKLTYDSIEESTTAEGEVYEVNSSTPGKLIVSDHGTLAEQSYTLTFKTKADARGDAAISLTKAGFSTAEDAATDDLFDCTDLPTATVTIKAPNYTITLPDDGSITDTVDSVAEGANYTFTLVDYAHYESGVTVTAQMGDKTVTATDNGNGTFTIANVKGDLSNFKINGTYKSYGITYDGTGAENMTATTAQYKSNVSITLPTQEGFTYSVTDVKRGGNSVDYTVEDNTLTFTMPGGDVVVTINKVSTNVSVKVEGTGIADVIANSTYEAGKAFEFTVNKDARYDYTVVVTVNGVEVTPAVSGNTYTIAADDVKAGGIVITVTKTLKTDNVSVSDFVSMSGGTSLFLVKVSSDKLTDGQVYTYDGKPMYWSEIHGGYCWLVNAASLIQSDAAAKVALTTGAAAGEIKASGDTFRDVNMSGTVDTNDAQLVYNMYKATYADMTDTVSMEKFLRADVNGENGINVDDAAAIVAARMSVLTAN